MKLERVHHVQIMIPAGKESDARDFYCGLLGLTEITKPAELAGRGGFWLELSGFQIHMGVGNGVKPENSREHVAFQVRGLEVWTGLLEGNKIEVKRGTSIPGYRRIEFRDPFNNRIEFLESV